MSSNEDVELYTNRKYEVLVRNETRFLSRNDISKEDLVTIVVSGILMPLSDSSSK